MTLSMSFSNVFVTVKPASRAKSKKAKSFSRSHGRYGVKKTNALEVGDFLSISCTVLTSCECAE